MKLDSDKHSIKWYSMWIVVLFPTIILISILPIYFNVSNVIAKMLVHPIESYVNVKFGNLESFISLVGSIYFLCLLIFILALLIINEKDNKKTEVDAIIKTIVSLVYFYFLYADKKDFLQPILDVIDDKGILLTIEMLTSLVYFGLLVYFTKDDIKIKYNKIRRMYLFYLLTIAIWGGLSFVRNFITTLISIILIVIFIYEFDLICIIGTSMNAYIFMLIPIENINAFKFYYYSFLIVSFSFLISYWIMQELTLFKENKQITNLMLIDDMVKLGVPTIFIIALYHLL